MPADQQLALLGYIAEAQAIRVLQRILYKAKSTTLPCTMRPNPVALGLSYLQILVADFHIAANHPDPLNCYLELRAKVKTPTPDQAPATPAEAPPSTDYQEAAQSEG